ncbi:MAG: GlxA family transcriptional regulator, partial [Streptomycetaceae bacterium]|nr:GlxA family transcriptional regulator [Streptomycetaceae bacterium]
MPDRRPAAPAPIPGPDCASAPAPRERRVVLIGYDGAALLDIACPVEAFDAANVIGADPPYRVELASLGGRPVRCASGFTLAAHLALEDVAGRVDTLLVAGGHGH